jgi:hypothetical protein
MGNPAIKRHYFFKQALRSIVDSMETTLLGGEMARMIGRDAELVNRLLRATDPDDKARVPSDPVLKELIKALNLTPEEAEHLNRMRLLDRVENRFGNEVNINGTTLPLDLSYAWEKLNGRQKAQIREMVMEFANESVVSPRKRGKV